MRARKPCRAGQHPLLTAAVNRRPSSGTSSPTSIVSPPSAARRSTYTPTGRPDACWSLAREEISKPRAATSGSDDFTLPRTMIGRSTAASAERLVPTRPSSGGAPIPRPEASPPANFPATLQGRRHRVARVQPECAVPPSCVETLSERAILGERRDRLCQHVTVADGTGEPVSPSSTHSTRTALAPARPTGKPASPLSSTTSSSDQELHHRNRRGERPIERVRSI
jgi:hypothetical protein